MLSQAELDAFKRFESRIAEVTASDATKDQFLSKRFFQEKIDGKVSAKLTGIQSGAAGEADGRLFETQHPLFFLMAAKIITPDNIDGYLDQFAAVNQLIIDGDYESAIKSLKTMIYDLCFDGSDLKEPLKEYLNHINSQVNLESMKMAMLHSMLVGFNIATSQAKLSTALGPTSPKYKVGMSALNALVARSMKIEQTKDQFFLAINTEIIALSHSFDDRKLPELAKKITELSRQIDRLKIAPTNTRDGVLTEIKTTIADIKTNKNDVLTTLEKESLNTIQRLLNFVGQAVFSTKFFTAKPVSSFFAIQNKLDDFEKFAAAYKPAAGK